MNPAFEAREVRVFGEMYRKGTIYKGMKPVYWCPKCETALAEAEIEYKTDACTSIYVKFRVRHLFHHLDDHNLDVARQPCHCAQPGREVRAGQGV